MAKKKDNKLLDTIKIILKRIKKASIIFLKKYWDIIVMNIIIFILTVFIESIYIHKLKLLVWFLNTILFASIPTIIMYLKRNMKTKTILMSIPILYILFLIFLDYCTIRELYGISSLGIDKTPNYVDAILVVFAFTMIEYVSALITCKFKKSK